MEKLLLSSFRETLSRFIVGFHPEQVNANLLIGKGEIVNVDLNVGTINALIFSKFTSKIQLQSAHITKLSFNVTSFTHLRKTPIVVTIDKIHIVLEEPMEFNGNISTSTSSTKKQLPNTKRKSYGLVEKITDNLTLVINEVNIRYETMGKFKTKRRGDWTPPQLTCQLKNLRYELTDEFGVVGSPEIVWRNTRVQRDEDNMRTWKIHKKCCMDLTLGLHVSPNENEMTHPFVNNCHVEVQIIMIRRLNDAGVLALQVDVSILDVQAKIAPNDIPLIAHAIAGLQYCMAKDRAFEDPLKPNYTPTTNNKTSDTQAHVSQNVEVTRTDSLSSKTNDLDSARASDNSIEDQEASFSLDDFDQNEGDDEDEDDYELNEEISESIESHLNDIPSTAGAFTPSKPRQLRPKILLKQTTEGPMLILHGGIVIFKSLTLSLSLHHCNVRVLYGTPKLGHFDIVLRGLITELILKKERTLKKGYFQLSLSCIKIQSFLPNGTTYPLLLGGFQHDHNAFSNNPNSSVPMFDNFISNDENFPLFAERSVLDDPIDLRHSFPAQCVGLKTSINMDNDSPNPFLVHEIGINDIELILDSKLVYPSLCHKWKDIRLDPRWYSGEWTESFKPEIMKVKQSSFNLQDHIQPVQPSGNIFDFFSNATVQGNTISLKIPAAITEDIHTSDIHLTLDGLMIIVSAELPRDFLDGKITGYNGNAMKLNEEHIIIYPNNQNDLCYDERLHDHEENNLCATKNPRIQVSISSLSIGLKPILSHLIAKQPQHFFSLKKLVILCSSDHFEEQIGNVLFLSTSIRNTTLNVDAELLASGMGTAIHHMEAIQTFLALLALSHSEENQIQLNKKKMQPQILFCAHLKRLEVMLWRQNVPSNHNRSDDSLTSTQTNAILLFKLTLVELELGLESRKIFPVNLIDMKSARNVYFSLLKCYIASILVEVNDENEKGTMSNGDESSINQFPTKENLKKLILVGESVTEENLFFFNNNNDDLETGILIRFESWDGSNMDIAIGANINKGMFQVDMNAINNITTLFLEGLLLPNLIFSSHNKSETKERKVEGTLFPLHTVGAAIEKTLNKIKYFQDNSLENIQKEQAIKEKGFIVSKFCVSNLAILIPEVESEKQVPAFCFGICINNFNLSASLFSSKSMQSIEFLQGSNMWETELRETSIGTHIIFDSQQSLKMISTQIDDGEKKLATTIMVPTFGTTLNLRPSTMNFALNNQIKCEQMDLLQRLQNCLIQIKTSGEEILQEFERVSPAIRTVPEIYSLPHIAQDTQFAKYVQSAKLMLSELYQLITSNEIALQTELLKKEKEIDDMRMNMFLKERQRIAALAILCHQCSGWVRIGDKSRDGARVLTTAALSNNWIVLRNSLIIVFSSPGVVAPNEIFPIKGAKLRFMLAGQRKIDAKRGFILTETNGRERIILVSNEKEYNKWAKALSKAIGKSNQLLTSTPNIKDGPLQADVDTEILAQDVEKVSNSYKQSPSIEANLSQANLDAKITPSTLLYQENDGTRTKDFVNDNVPMNDEIISKDAESNNELRSPSTPQLPNDMEILSESQLASKSEPQSKTPLIKNPSQQLFKDKFSSMKTFSNKKMSRFGATLRSANSKTPDAEEEDHRKEQEEVNPKELDYESDEEFDTVSLQSTQASTQENQNEASKSSSQSRRARMREKMSSIHVNAKISQIGSAVKSVRSDSETLKRLSNVKFQGSARRSFANSKIFSSSTSRNVKDADIVKNDHVSKENLNQEVKMEHMSSGENSSEENSDMEIVDLDGSYHDMNHSSTNDFKLVSEKSHSDSVSNSHALSRRDQLRRKIGMVPSINMNEKLAKFGSAVKSVRPNVNTIKHLNSDSFQSANTILGSTLSIKNTSNLGPQNGDNSDITERLKIKDIHIINIEESKIENDKEAEPYETISGQWIAHVKLIKNTSTVSTDDKESFKFTPPNESHEDKFSDAALPEKNQMESITKNETSPLSNAENTKEDDLLLFEIRIVSGGTVNLRTTKIVHKRLSDIIALHTLISEAVAQSIPEQYTTVGESNLNQIPQTSNSEANTSSKYATQTLSSELGLTPIDQVRFSGRLLQGLLSVSPQHKNDVAINTYRGEILSEFLNSCLQNPLPTKGRIGLETFLDITNVTYSDDKQNQDNFSPVTESIAPSEKRSPPMSTRTSEMITLASACSAELIRAENTKKTFEIKKCSSSLTMEKDQEYDSKPTSIFPTTSCTSSESNFASPLLHMQKAIMKAMTERDERHAQLVAAKVLHKHELDQERKKSDGLKARCISLEKHIDGGLGASNAFFVGANVIAKEQQRKIRNEMIQDTETELLELCKQLTFEITEKTKASLEVIRLKEMLALDNEVAKTEKEALESEAKKLKDDAEKEKMLKDQALKEMEHWKNLYENMVNTVK